MVFYWLFTVFKQLSIIWYKVFMVTPLRHFYHNPLIYSPSFLPSSLPSFLPWLEYNRRVNILMMLSRNLHDVLLRRSEFICCCFNLMLLLNLVSLVYGFIILPTLIITDLCELISEGQLRILHSWLLVKMVLMWFKWYKTNRSTKCISCINILMMLSCNLHDVLLRRSEFICCCFNLMLLLNQV